MHSPRASISTPPHDTAPCGNAYPVIHLLELTLGNLGRHSSHIQALSTKHRYRYHRIYSTWTFLSSIIPSMHRREDRRGLRSVKRHSLSHENEQHCRVYFPPILWALMGKIYSIQSLDIETKLLITKVRGPLCTNHNVALLYLYWISITI